MSPAALSPEQVEAMFREAGALLEGHFRLSSGRHSPRFLQSARVLRFPDRAERLARALAAHLRDRGIQQVVAPALGGVVIGHEVARALGVPMLFAEKDPEGRFHLRRGFELEPGSRVAVVEDVLTTRGSAARAAAMCEAAGAEVVAVGALADRGPGGAELPVEPVVLWEPEVPTYEADACPLCRDGAPPPVKPGSAASARA